MNVDVSLYVGLTKKLRLDLLFFTDIDIFPSADFS